MARSLGGGPSVNPNGASVNWQAKTINDNPTLLAVNRLNLTKMKKIANLALYLLSGTLLFLACSKDDPDKPTPVEEQNTAPVVKAQTFTVMESATEIGTVNASDEDGDQLTFSITVNDNALFAIDNTGKITLAEGKALDFDTTPSHTITVQVEDKEDKASAQMTVNLTDTNDIAPVFEEEGYSFEAFEDIAQDVVMGTVAGSDPEGAPVTYKITEDENELFAIDGNTGEITLAEGKQLDFEAFEGSEPVHNIVVEVSDGELTAEVNVAITVLNIPEAQPDDPAAFVTTWQAGSGETIEIGLNDNDAGYGYDFTINWGDDVLEDITLNSFNQDIVEHTYASEGEYTVSIVGVFPAILMDSSLTPENLLSIEQWGSIEWQSMYLAFSGCENMVYNAKDVPNLTKVTNLEGMFAYSFTFNGDLSGWNTGTIESMQEMFERAYSFEGIGLETWKTQNVTDMAGMFKNATSFNADLGNWNTENIIVMTSMFRGATGFEGIGLEDWKTQNVSYMSRMFQDAENFSADISGWDTGEVISMHRMFENATNFDRDLGNWNIQNIMDMGLMLDNSGMSNENYGNTLMGWATLDQGEEKIPTGVELGAAGLQYSCDLTPGAEDAHDTLSADPYNWNIQDESPVDCGGGL